ncbi:MAG: hypothetical protein RR349_07765, partial [Oscillospiraceae bacterium]
KRACTGQSAINYEKCNNIAKPGRAEQSRRPYGVGRIRQDCNVPQRLWNTVRLQNAAKLQKPGGRSRATAHTEVVERSSIAKTPTEWGKMR